MYLELDKQIKKTSPTRINREHGIITKWNEVEHQQILQHKADGETRLQLLSMFSVQFEFLISAQLITNSNCNEILSSFIKILFGNNYYTQILRNTH